MSSSNSECIQVFCENYVLKFRQRQELGLLSPECVCYNFHLWANFEQINFQFAFAYLDVLVDDLPAGGVDEAHLDASRADVDAHDVRTHLLLHRGLKQYTEEMLKIFVLDGNGFKFTNLSHSMPNCVFCSFCRHCVVLTIECWGVNVFTEEAIKSKHLSFFGNSEIIWNIHNICK